MIYNTYRKEYQFYRIYSDTEKGAYTMLKNIIGNDSRKGRFAAIELPKEEANKIRYEIYVSNISEDLIRILPKLTIEQAKNAVRKYSEKEMR